MTLIPTGQLPNIALFLLLYPELKPRIAHSPDGRRRLRGERHPCRRRRTSATTRRRRASSSRSGLPITMVGLNVTHRALFTDGAYRLAAETGRRVAPPSPMLEFPDARLRREYGYAGAPLHDPIAVAAVFRPGSVTTRDLRRDSKLLRQTSPFTAGRSVVDLTGVTERPPNAAVAMNVLCDETLADYPGDTHLDTFQHLLLEAIASYD